MIFELVSQTRDAYGDTNADQSRIRDKERKSIEGGDENPIVSRKKTVRNAMMSKRLSIKYTAINKNATITKYFCDQRCHAELMYNLTKLKISKSYNFRNIFQYF